jgi:predicted MPP superfamily phosphohydrolase
MILSNILYNLLLAVATAALLFHLSRRRTLLMFVALGVLLGTAAMLAAAAIGVGIERNSFASMRLLAYGVFIHVPVYAAVAAGMLWRTKRFGAVFAGASALAIAGVGIDAFFIEPHWLEVTHYEIASRKIKKPLRIAVLADIQTDDVGDYELDVLRRALAEKPDIVVFPGDYLQIYSAELWRAQRDKLRAVVLESQLDAPLGMFAVAGNVDHPDWPQIFDGTKVVANDETRSIQIGPDDKGDNAGTITISLLSENASYEQNGADSLAAPESAFHICVGHRPDFALGSPKADLLIAGHTHGGQVQLPSVGPLITLSRVRRSWASGLNEIRAGQHLFVSRGIGMERGEAPRLRFLCRPELAIIDVVPE